MKKQRGFTLIELMIVVAIIGILAGIALPAYNDYVLRGKLVEAFTELATMRVKLEQYYQDHRTYAGFDCTAVSAAKYFAYSCDPAPDATSFTAIATGDAAQGTGDFIYTINQSNAKATTSAPAGWGAPKSCWITKKGGAC